MAEAVLMVGVTKRFGTTTAVESLDLAIERGTIAGFIGPNGAGKTTTIRMLLSIIDPDVGSIAVLGRPLTAESKDRIGYLPEERGVYRKMKVGAFLAYIARLKGVTAGGVEARVKDWLDRVGLAHCYGKRCQELSKGMQQKVQFVAAVIHEPDLLVLDEPFSGLDPVATRLLRDLIVDQKKAGKTVIFSTHVMHQAEELCDHLFMIDAGRKVLDGTLASIQARFEATSIEIEPMDDRDGIDVLRGLGGVVFEPTDAAQPAHRRFRLSLDGSRDPTSIIRAIVERIAVRRVELVRPSLEEVFLRVVGRQHAEAPDA